MYPLKSLASILAFFSAAQSGGGHQSLFTYSLSKYCNAVQKDVGFIRYPLGMIAVSSTQAGEIADAMTLVPKVYPCLDSVVFRGENEDWRMSVDGDPSQLAVRYNADKPSGAAVVMMTVSPHVSVFKITFPETTREKYIVFDFTKYRVDSWAKLNQWHERKARWVDARTIQATVGMPGQSGAYYTIRFSEPCIRSGTIDSTGRAAPVAIEESGARLGIFTQFQSSPVTVAIAVSFEGMANAKKYLAAEFSDYETVQERSRIAWDQVLKQVEMEGSENSKRMAYSALYTMLVNILDGRDGSCYLDFYSRPRSLASSAYWQFIGGFQSCCWDNFRTAYPFLMLGYPEVMDDIVNTYLARFQRDGFVAGNICLFTGPTADHESIRFTPVLVAEAQASGIHADYASLYAALKDNFEDERYLAGSFTRLGYITQPPSGGKACSHTLEFAASLEDLAILAKNSEDRISMQKYLRLSKNYVNLWDSTQMAFRVKNEDGSWGPVEYRTNTWNPNPQGLFEGTTADWMFAVPQDPYGLIHLPGQKDFVKRVVDYCEKDTWFNDYQYGYPYLLYYTDAANEAQKILRNTWIPLFKEGILYEGVSPKPGYVPWKTHYTSNAGWLLCSMLGLYPTNAPSGQYIISSPAIKKAVIQHGNNQIVIQTRNQSDENIYIQSIKLDGKSYPCYMIPAQRLIRGAKIELDLSGDPSTRLGDLYLSSTDGFVRSAELISDSELKCVIEASILDATTHIYCREKPVQVRINGKEEDSWRYDDTAKIATIRTAGLADIQIRVR